MTALISLTRGSMPGLTISRLLCRIGAALNVASAIRLYSILVGACWRVRGLVKRGRLAGRIASARLRIQYAPHQYRCAGPAR
jgi:hypothetical protein